MNKQQDFIMRPTSGGISNEEDYWCIGAGSGGISNVTETI